MAAGCTTVFPVRDYDLAATLDSGQAFRWQAEADAWVGAIHGRWVRLRPVPDGIHAETARPQTDWRWLADYLQVEVDLAAVLAHFPEDPQLREAVNACHGLRLLRQEPWECLASFILSSTKQIVQIRQIIALLAARHGEPLPGPAGQPTLHSFPDAARIAALSETELRACKMGFRAPYLRATAQAVAGGKVNLAALSELPLAAARAELMQLPGVGRKIADCVLLFSCGFAEAFPVDVWIARALQELYFPRRRANARRLERFVATHFGPQAGYAQQYLFHYMRTRT